MNLDVGEEYCVVLKEQLFYFLVFYQNTTWWLDFKALLTMLNGICQFMVLERLLIILLTTLIKIYFGYDYVTLCRVFWSSHPTDIWV